MHLWKSLRTCHCTTTRSRRSEALNRGWFGEMVVFKNPSKMGFPKEKAKSLDGLDWLPCYVMLMDKSLKKPVFPSQIGSRIWVKLCHIQGKWLGKNQGREATKVPSVQGEGRNCFLDFCGLLIPTCSWHPRFTPSQSNCEWYSFRTL